MKKFKLAIDKGKCIEPQIPELRLEITEDGFNLRDRKNFCVIHADTLLTTGIIGINTGNIGSNKIKKTKDIEDSDWAGRTEFTVTDESEC